MRFGAGEPPSVGVFHIMNGAWKTERLYYFKMHMLDDCPSLTTSFIGVSEPATFDPGPTPTPSV